MIKNYSDILKKVDVSSPRSIQPGFFNEQTVGFTLDFFYGPYDTPEVLTFIVDSEDGDITRPNANDDAEGVYENVGGTLVYNSRLNYQKALAEQMLTDMHQFFEGKKVAFINDDGNPIEYIVVPDENGDLYFEDARLVDKYTITFRSLSATGEQPPIEVVSQYYTLPKSDFIPPTENFHGTNVPQLFEGWQFGYTDRSGHVVLDTDENGDDVIYDVGRAVNLKDWCENSGVKKNEVTLYANYMTRDNVMVDFENGYYDSSDEFVTMDGGDDNSGYIMVQYGSNSNNTKPEDWDTMHATYFTRAQVISGSGCRYEKVGWRKAWNYLRGNNMNGREWTEEHYVEWFGSGGDDFNPDPAAQTGLVYNNGVLQFVNKKRAGVNESGMSPKEITKSRDWYMLRSDYGYAYIYSPCGPDYNQYKNDDLFTHIIRDSFAAFNNGEILGNVQYDCLDNTTCGTFQGLTVQLNSTIMEPFNERFEFDHWEIIPQKCGSSDILSFENIDGASFEDSFINATFRLDTVYEVECEEDNETYEGYVSADRYIFRAVYRKRDDFYAKLYVKNNYNENDTDCPVGVVAIEGQYRTNRNRLEIKSLGTLSEHGVLSVNSGVNGISSGYDENGSYIELDPTRIITLKLTATPEVGFEFYTWTGGSVDLNRRYVGIAVLQNIEVQRGGMYDYKAWFVREGDVSATVRVSKRLSTPRQVLSGYNGSSVGIYGYKMVNVITGHIPAQATQVVPGAEYMYQESSMVPSHMVPVSMVGIEAVGEPTNGYVGGVSVQRQYKKTIDTDNPLGNPAVISIDETGHGYCFIKASIGENNGASFIMWEDGNTNPVRLVDVTLPTQYAYTAIFQGTPMYISTDIAHMSFIETSRYDFYVTTTNGEENSMPYSVADISERVAANIMAISEDGDTSFASIKNIGNNPNPQYDAGFTTITDIIRASSEGNETVTDTMYDYDGNMYQNKETSVLEITVE